VGAAVVGATVVGAVVTGLVVTGALEPALPEEPELPPLLAPGRFEGRTVGTVLG